MKAFYFLTFSLIVAIGWGSYLSVTYKPVDAQLTALNTLDNENAEPVDVVSGTSDVPTPIQEVPTPTTTLVKKTTPVVNAKPKTLVSPVKVTTKPSSSSVDSTPPSAPRNLSAVPALAKQINLYWVKSTDNIGIADYHVFRNTKEIATTPYTNYIDLDIDDLSGSNLFNYYVIAYDLSGNPSPMSNIDRVTTNELAMSVNTEPSAGPYVATTETPTTTPTPSTTPTTTPSSTPSPPPSSKPTQTPTPTPPEKKRRDTCKEKLNTTHFFHAHFNSNQLCYLTTFYDI